MANLVKWTPHHDLFDFETDMKNMFGNYFMTKKGKHNALAAWMPLVDIEESKDKFTVKADIPGMKKEDIKVELSENMLTISGERTKTEKTEKGDYCRIERTFGTFHRRFELPGDLDTEKITAHYENGVLELRIPMLKEVEKKHVKISIE